MSTTTLETVDSARDPGTRRSGLGSSDAAAAVGLDPYTTPLDLYLEKIGIVAAQDVRSEASYWGTRLESLLLAEYARRQEVRVLGRVRGAGVVFLPDGEIEPRADHELLRTLRHPDIAWMFAHLDGLALSNQGTPIAGVECKTAGHFAGRDFGADEDTDQVPEHYLVQAAHAQEVLRHVIGVALPWRFAVLIGGQRWRRYEVSYNPELARVLVEREAEFWARVRALEAPPPTPDARGVESLRRLFPADDGETLVVQPGTPLWDVALRLRDAQAARRQSQNEYDEARTYVMRLMGTAARLLNAEGKTLARWSNNRPTREIDWRGVAGEFARHAGISDADQSRIIDTFTSEKPGPRVFDAQWIGKLAPQREVT